MCICLFVNSSFGASGATTKSVLPGMSETLNYFAVEPQSKSYPSYGDIVNVMNNVVCLQGS